MPKEKEPEFTVTDRRKFTLEGEPLPQTSTPETSQESTQPEPPPATQPAPPPAVAANPSAQPEPLHIEPLHTDPSHPDPSHPEPSPRERQQQADQYQQSSRQFDSHLQRELDSQGQGHQASDFEITFEKFIASLYMTALMQLGLLQLALGLAVDNGFIPMIPPVLVRPEVMAGTGFLGAHADEVYRLEADDLYLVGTSEVPLAGYHSDEIVDLSGGPLRYAGWSSCFRREAGSYGKDTRGIIRVHQFDKVEGFVYCMPDDAEAEHQRLLGWQREMLARIEVPYRVIDVAAGDLGASAARKFDCEAWVPTQQTYRELTSTSNCTTFQARRLATRYRDANGKPDTAATLNGTLGTTRWLVSILENHQQPDGSVRVPAALVPFVGTELLAPTR